MSCRYRVAQLIGASLILIGAGCAEPVGVRPINYEKSLQEAQRSGLTGREPSEQTARLLRRRVLSERFDREPGAVLDELAADLADSCSRELSVALAELCYMRGNRERRFGANAEFMYTSALVYAYAYLFDQKLEPEPQEYDPRFRRACDLYNLSLARIVEIWERNDVRWGSKSEMPFLSGRLELKIGRWDLHWPPGSYASAETVFGFRVTGLQNHYWTAGLGVPAIVSRAVIPREDWTAEDKFLIVDSQQAFPATAMINILEGSLCGARADEGLPAVAEAFDPMNRSEIEVGGTMVPLQTDVTTPLAYMLEHVPPISGIEGLLDVESWDDRQGLAMLQPYDPDKIPVVFVHGLVSSPMTWLQMFNEVTGDPELRERYQVWFFMYPTGNPIIFSANLLRQALKDVQAFCDPEGTDLDFNSMVLVGHSMGGMLSRLNMQSSGDDLWRQLVKTGTVDELDMADDKKEMLKQIFYFEPHPFVRRLVFVATPHRGSNLADKWFAHLGSSWVKLPSTLLSLVSELLVAVPKEDLTEHVTGKLSTSIDDLSPESLDVQFMSSHPIAEGVPYHSIIADDKGADRTGGTDTIVPYWSSHLDDAVSEKVVKGTHACTGLPSVALEMRRILRQHLREIDQSASTERAGDHALRAGIKP